MPSTSTKQTTTSDLKSLNTTSDLKSLNTKKRPQHMACFKIQVLVWDRHKNVMGLEEG